MIPENLSGYLPEISWIVFGCVFIFFAITSAILNYHWTHYGLQTSWLKSARIIYLGVSLALLAAMLILLSKE